MMAIGTGSPEFAMFHLLTHAFFKACLFLSAGSVIHSMHEVAHKLHLDVDAQDMRNMGGLRSALPITFWAFLLSGASLAGLPLFSGFLSKDAILGSSLSFAQEMGGVAWILPILGFLTALLTAFYIAKQIMMVFLGQPRLEALQGKVEESGKRITFPLIVLAIFSIWLPFSLSPVSGLNGWFLGSFTSSDWGNSMLWAEIGSVLLGSLGIFLAYQLVMKKTNLWIEWHFGAIFWCFIKAFLRVLVF